MGCEYLLLDLINTVKCSPSEIEKVTSIGPRTTFVRVLRVELIDTGVASVPELLPR